MKRKFFSSLIFILLFAQCAQADAKSDFQAGHNKLVEGNLGEALYYLNSACADSSFILKDYAQYEIAEVYFKNGNYGIAAPEYLKVGSDNPLYPQALVKSADCYEKADNINKAAEVYRKFLSSFPDDENAAEAGFKLALICEKQKKIKEAYQILNKVDLYHPISSYAKQSRLALKRLIKNYHLPAYKANPKDLYKKGLASFRAENYDEAEAVFLKLARDYPKSKYAGEAFMMVGRSEFSGDKINEAISNITKSLNYTPEKQRAKNLYYLGRAYGRRGKYERAMVYMKKILVYYPTSSCADDACYYLALYYEYSGSPKAATSTYLYLVEKYPRSPYIDKAIFRAGLICYKAYDFDAAYNIFSLSKIKNVGAETPKCLLWWGKLAERLGKIDAAAGIYNYLAERFDHTYAAYRASEKLSILGYKFPNGKAGSDSAGEIGNAMPDNEEDNDLLSDMDDFLEKNKSASENNQENIERYKLLVELGFSLYAAKEVEGILAVSGSGSQESAQITMGKILHEAGEFRTPIGISEGKVKNAILAGKPDEVPSAFWELAYPKGFWPDVLKFSKENEVDPYLTLAVIREESRFNPKALSRSRAHGLMQIIPSTGRLIAKDLGISPFNRKYMFNVETNIMMGTYYLKEMIDSFQGNIFLALAGYNGGSGRVKKWVNNWYNGDMKNLDIDEFIEYIPLLETRKYVQKVMGSYYEYKRVYGGRSQDS